MKGERENRKEPKHASGIWKETAQNQSEAYRKGDEAAQRARKEKIVLAIEKLVEQVNRYGDENSPEEKSKRRWEKSGVVGLWAAAVVGAVAIVAGRWDADSQRRIIIRQTSEMAAAREQSISSERARLAMGQLTLSLGTEKEVPTISFSLLNMGRTPAVVSRLSSECSIIGRDGIDLIASYSDWAARPASNAVGGGATFTGGIISPCKIIDFNNEEASIKAGSKVYFIKGFVTFSDVYNRNYTQRFADFAGQDGVFYPLMLGLYNAETWDDEPPEENQTNSH